MSDVAVPEGFSVRVVRRGDTAVVIPTGELDHGSAPALEASLIRAFAEELLSNDCGAGTARRARATRLVRTP